MHSFIAYDTPFIRCMRYTTEPRATIDNSIPVTCNSKLPRCYTKTEITAEQFILGMWPTISHILSPKQHSMIRVVRIPHVGTKRKPLTKAVSPNILVLWWPYMTISKLCLASCAIMCNVSLALTCVPHITEWHEDEGPRY